MTSWTRFLFHAATWSWRIYLTLAFPLYAPRVSQTWKYAGGWVQRFGKRAAVGIKPPAAMAQADRSIGLKIFKEATDIEDKVSHVTCHELTHAFTSHLGLPAWLNEGLAIMTVDAYTGEPTVKEETLDLLARGQYSGRPADYGKVSVKDPERITYVYIRGYWITRFIEESNPGLLQGLLKQRRSEQGLERELADSLDLAFETFWNEIDALVVAHFRRQGENN